MLKIRLRRVGKKRHPYYRLVVANKPDKRDGDFLETLGSYDPHQDPPTITLDEEKTRAWLSKGAQPSEAAAKILTRAGIATPAGAAAAVRPSKPPAVAPAPPAAVGKAAAKAKAAQPPSAQAPAAEAPAPPTDDIEAPPAPAVAVDEEPAETAPSNDETAVAPSAEQEPATEED
ncbi:MAG: 30S ribosomal protein S16 [Tepidiformaceae bacterium]